MSRDEMREVGQKCRAERLVSEYIRAVGTEKTEITTVFSDPDTGEKRIISKAEALARDIWKLAMECEDAKLKLDYRKLLLDRVEGRPGAMEGEAVPKRRDVPDKVSKKGRDKLNRLARDGEETEE